MSDYFLQIRESERKALLASTSRPVKGAYAEDLEAVHDSLKSLKPNHTFIVEVPPGIDPNKIRVISSLEMDAQFYVMHSGSNGNIEPAAHVRDHSRIYRIMTGIRLSKVIVPLMLAADALRRGLQDSCETSSPDLSAILTVLHAFRPTFSEAFKEVSALVREERRETRQDDI